MAIPLDRGADLVRELYALVAAGDGWPRILARLTREFHSTYSMLMEQARLTGTTRVIATDMLPRDRQRAYEGHYRRLSPVLAQWSDLEPGAVFTDALYGEDYPRSEIYSDF